MGEIVHTFCDQCMQKVDAEVRVFHGRQTMRGIELEVTETWPVCPICGNRIALGTYAQENDEQLYSAYRKYWMIPSGEEVRTQRESLGLSQQAFADLLGIGVASVQRYEKGSLPTEAHAALLKRIFDPVSQRELLDEAVLASPEVRDRIARSIDEASTPEQEAQSLSRRGLRMFVRTPGLLTGNVRFNADKLIALLAYLASHARGLYRTKLNKVLFYLDFSMFRDYGCGVTGLRYAHADYGPVPDNYDMLVDACIATGPLYFEEQESGGQILRTTIETPTLDLFSDDEAGQIDRVIRFANLFPTATALTEASHRERAWLETGSGQLIPYDMAATLKGVE